MAFFGGAQKTFKYFKYYNQSAAFRRAAEPPVLFLINNSETF